MRPVMPVFVTKCAPLARSLAARARCVRQKLSVDVACVLVTFAIAVAASALSLAVEARSEPRAGIAMHGAPRHEAGLPHFAYADPTAPKGGRLTLGVLGSYDSLNPLILRGVAAAGIRDFVYESLMTRALDEPFTLYAGLAESIDTPPDRSTVTFRLDAAAQFSDGSPVTADDVIFSHATLRDLGRPNLRTYYAKVASAERIDARTVRFVLREAGDRELPLILGLMPVLPRHRLTAQTFERTSLEPPIGSGPYVVDRLDAGRSIVYRRNPGYWAADRPFARGRFNFDEIRFEYFRDASTMLEAFKSGEIDLRAEDDPGRWAGGYDFPAVRDGRVIRAEIPLGIPAGMTALAFNTRRAPFGDIRVRRALGLAFDFPWINKSLYNGLYRRTQSFFERSALSSHGRPADARERSLLAAYPDAVPNQILESGWQAPATPPGGHNREGLRRAVALMAQAGYVLRDGRMVAAATRRPLTFEILASSRNQERLLLAYTASLARIGIRATVRQVDSAQYQSRLKSYDFDMIQASWPASLSPGNEQLFRWSSKAAATEGTFNYPGVASPAADAMIAALLAAETPEDFASAVRALDRVLLAGDYVVPLFHLPGQWLAYWARLGRPATGTLYGYAVDTWWVKPAAGTPPAGR